MMATATEKYACVRREVIQRQKVYPRLIERGSMTDGFAMTQIKLMQEIEEDYRKLAEKERLL